MLFNNLIKIIKNFKKWKLMELKIWVNSFFLVINDPNWANKFVTISKLNYLNWFSHFQITLIHWISKLHPILQIDCNSNSKTFSNLHEILAVSFFLPNWEFIKLLFWWIHLSSRPGVLNKDPTVWLDGARPPQLSLIMSLVVMIWWTQNLQKFCCPVKFQI